MPVILRSFAVADTDDVVALWEQAQLTRPWNDPRADIARKLQVDPELFLVADDGGAVVGTAMGGYDGHRGTVYYVATAPERRGEGIGGQLLAEVERLLLERGCPKINLMVRPENTAVHGFYAHAGYQEFATTNFGKRLIADAP